MVSEARSLGARGSGAGFFSHLSSGATPQMSPVPIDEVLRRMSPLARMQNGLH